MRWSTRADWNARPPRAVRTDITPVGVAVHWPGGGTYRRTSHADCLRLVRGWQDAHMTTAGVNDLYYNLLCCWHGYLIEGRSTRARPRVRGGANGTSASNAAWYSLLVMWGAGDGPPPDAILAVARDGIDWLRSAAGAGTRLSGHRDHTATECPGDQLYAWARAGAPRPTGGDVPTAEQIVDELLAREASWPQWMRDRWPGESGKSSMLTYFRSGYGHGRAAKDDLARLRAELAEAVADVKAHVDDELTRSRGEFDTGNPVSIASIGPAVYAHRAWLAGLRTETKAAATTALLHELVAAHGDGLTVEQVREAARQGAQDALPDVHELAAAVADAVDHDLDTAAVEQALRTVLGSLDQDDA